MARPEPNIVSQKCGNEWDAALASTTTSCVLVADCATHRLPYHTTNNSNSRLQRLRCVGIRGSPPCYRFNRETLPGDFTIRFVPVFRPPMCDGGAASRFARRVPQVFREAEVP